MPGISKTLTLLVIAGTVLGACHDEDDDTDILPDCTIDGPSCRNGLTCFADDAELQCGYCTTDCSGGAACPVGADCAFNDVCLVLCRQSGDCPRSYQVCSQGFCASPADKTVTCD